jgi:hypothetical protein
MDKLPPLESNRAPAVVAGPAASAPAKRARIAASPFLAHLLAAECGALQHRARRRETPEAAIAAYRAASRVGATRLSVAA